MIGRVTIGEDASIWPGAVVRGDVGTIRSHLTVLRELAPGALPLYVAVARREFAIGRRRGELTDDVADELEQLLSGAVD